MTGENDSENESTVVSPTSFPASWCELGLVGTSQPIRGLIKGFVRPAPAHL